MANIIAQSDVGTMLYAKTTDGKFEEFLEITSAPAEGSAGGTIEVTVLKSAIKQYIPDRPDTPDQDFNYNYTETNFTKAQEYADGDAHEFLVKFQDGTGYVITGSAQTWINEVSRGSAVEATFHVVASNIAWKTSTEVTSLLA
jgi:hypothetical protein